MIGLEDAVVRFQARTVLDRLTFAVGEGRSLAILGPNGRGKTTALRALLGFQPLASGRRHAPAIVGYVPQASGTTLRYSVLDMVVMGRAGGLGLFGQPGPQDREAARAALAEVGISGLEQARYDVLSGGERQLVLLARALATGSPVLVLDEPGSALDLANQERLLSLLDRLRGERRRTILFTTHDPNHALAIADEALLLMPDGGSVTGPVGEVVDARHLERLFGVPMRLVGFDDREGCARHAVLPAFAGGRSAA